MKKAVVNGQEISGEFKRHTAALRPDGRTKDDLASTLTHLEVFMCIRIARRDELFFDILHPVAR